MPPPRPPERPLFDTVNIDRWVSDYCDVNRRRNFPARSNMDGGVRFCAPGLMRLVGGQYGNDDK